MDIGAYRLLQEDIRLAREQVEKRWREMFDVLGIQDLDPNDRITTFKSNYNLSK